MEEAAIATSHKPARFFALAVVAVSLIAALSANAAGTKAVKHNVKKAKVQERRVRTSRSSQDSAALARLRQIEALDYEPRQSGYDILVDKSDRRMTIFMGGNVYRTYQIRLGFTPDGHKTRRGDGRTPEGRYFIGKRNPQSAYYRSLFVSYPAPKDAKAGVECGLVGSGTYNAVCRAYDRGALPPQETRLGGNICIHGEGSRPRGDEDWTAGCIAVTNDEMTEIWNLIPIGTPVTIRA